MCDVAKATIGDCLPQRRCTSQRHYKLCAWLQRQPHATACHSITVCKVRLPHASQQMPNEMRRIAQVAACYSVPEHRCVQAKGTTNCMPGCRGNHLQHRATASMCTSCACLMQASIGTMKCAKLQRQPLATACLSVAVRAKGTISCVPGCKGNHMRQRATTSLCARCACLMQASICTMKCAVLQK